MAGSPGTISNVRFDRDTALTSVITASTDIGSPATRRTTSAPVLASATRVLATSAGSPSAGRTSGPTETTGGAVWSSPGAAGRWGAGPAAGGRSVPTSLSTASGTSGSVKTQAALASTALARVVSNPGSPGPDPTNVILPGLTLRPLG